MVGATCFLFEELVLLWGRATFLRVAGTYFPRKDQMLLAAADTHTLHVLSQGFLLLYSRHVQTKPGSEKDLVLLSNATCLLL